MASGATTASHNSKNGVCQCLYSSQMGSWAPQRHMRSSTPETSHPLTVSPALGAYLSTLGPADFAFVDISLLASGPLLASSAQWF